MNEIKLSELNGKEKIAAISRNYINDILEGNVNPLEAMTVVAALENFVKAVRGNVLVKDAVREELEKYGTKSVDFKGAKFTMKEVGTRYDFSSCGDPKWSDLKFRIDELTADLKEREKLLKALPDGGMMEVDQKTGEVYHIEKPEKKFENGYSITFYK